MGVGLRTLQIEGVAGTLSNLGPSRQCGAFSVLELAVVQFLLELPPALLDVLGMAVLSLEQGYRSVRAGFEALCTESNSTTRRYRPHLHKAASKLTLSFFNCVLVQLVRSFHRLGMLRAALSESTSSSHRLCSC